MCFIPASRGTRQEDYWIGFILDRCFKRCRRIQLRDEHHHILLLKGVMEIEDPLIVQLRQQLHLSEGQAFPLAPCTNELGSEFGLSLFLSHPLHVGEGTPALRRGDFGINEAKSRQIKWRICLVVISRLRNRSILVPNPCSKLERQSCVVFRLLFTFPLLTVVNHRLSVNRCDPPHHSVRAQTHTDVKAHSPPDLFVNVIVVHQAPHLP